MLYNLSVIHRVYLVQNKNNITQKIRIRENPRPEVKRVIKPNTVSSVPKGTLVVAGTALRDNNPHCQVRHQQSYGLVCLRLVTPF
jgi:hypothetical protein